MLTGAEAIPMPGKFDLKDCLRIVITEYGGAVEDFVDGLETSISDYGKMVVKQRYLLAAAGTIKRTAEIFGHEGIHRATDLLEAAASSYLDDADRLAHEELTDNRFLLDEGRSRVLGSRLRMRAEKSRRIWEIYCRHFREAEDVGTYTLNFILEIALAMPIGAWECACCLAVDGNCEECGYGRDHYICSSPGSTYEMLSKSHRHLVESIRRSLGSRAREENERFEAKEQGSEDDFGAFRPLEEIDIYGDSEVVKGVYD